MAPAMGAVAYLAHRTLAGALASLRREPRRAADPRPEIVQRTAGQRALLCQRLGGSAQPLAVLPKRKRTRERRKQSEIDVHRLVGARAGIDRVHMAAGDVVEQGPMRRGRRWWSERLA